MLGQRHDEKPLKDLNRSQVPPPGKGPARRATADSGVDSETSHLPPRTAREPPRPNTTRAARAAEPGITLLTPPPGQRRDETGQDGAGQSGGRWGGGRCVDTGRHGPRPAR
ncbi:hypothetical protein GCM10010215_48660 [Streptomyces virginiae]|uniref:Uncharacterized protein n=1 Tax=Streptomyces virginiae TaxID=1961 RepID=A0ABQ3NXD6_STRVG|nr:hypothetical protein GCM10010215_48660 [Streptomyces virginiae]GHI14912.1 hypothetical protein Scinn_43750 [Streptomyces virginiae]GHI17426.1 hypothetical protein Scinn_68890 [Streptomyces virginiae]